MSSFSNINLVKKLNELNNTQQSIQTLSLWLIHHRKHSKVIVQAWYRELEKAKPSRRLTFVYLANDVIQNSKKKGPEFSKDFAHILPDGFTQAAKDADDKMKGSLKRVLSIWKERGIYDKALVKRLKECMNISSTKPSKSSKSSSKSSSSLSSSSLSSFQLSTSKTAQPKPSERSTSSSKSSKTITGSTKKGKESKPEYSLRQEVEAMGAQLPENVDAEDLVQRLSDLENSASCDASVREKIAAFPPEVSDISHLDRIEDRESLDRLSDKVDEAALLLNEYNRRLVAELEERKKVARMLRSYILAQQKQLTSTEKNLQEWSDKLNKVTNVRQELMSHIQKLPDLTLLPDVTGGLPPLPSAGDLFYST